MGQLGLFPLLLPGFPGFLYDSPFTLDYHLLLLPLLPNLFLLHNRKLCNRLDLIEMHCFIGSAMNLGLLRDDPLNVGNGLLEDLVEDLGVLELLLNLGNDAVGEFLLLADLDLALVADPGVKDGLGLGGNGGLLLELESLCLDASRLLLDEWVNPMSLEVLRKCYASMAYLGHLKEVLGDLDYSAKILDTLDPLLYGRGVVLPGAVEDVLDLVGLTLGPLLVSWTSVDGNTGVDGEEASQNNGLLVDDVKLVADGGNGNTGASGEDGGLGEKVAARQRVEDALGLLLGSNLVGLEAGLDSSRDSVLGKVESGRTRAGGACDLRLATAHVN